MKKTRGFVLLWAVVLLSIAMMSLLFVRENGLRLSLEARGDLDAFQARQAQENLLQILERELVDRNFPPNCWQAHPLITQADLKKAVYCSRLSEQQTFSVAVSPWSSRFQITIWDSRTRTLLQSATRFSGTRQSFRWMQLDD